MEESVQIHMYVERWFRMKNPFKGIWELVCRRQDEYDIIELEACGLEAYYD